MVKFVVVEAVRKVGIPRRWRDFQAQWEPRFSGVSTERLFHSFLPADRCSFFSPLAALFAHGFAAHFDAVGVVYQPVEDGIGQGGIADLVVPAGHRQLRGQDRRERARSYAKRCDGSHPHLEQRINGFEHVCYPLERRRPSIRHPRAEPQDEIFAVEPVKQQGER